MKKFVLILVFLISVFLLFAKGISPSPQDSQQDLSVLEAFSTLSPIFWLIMVVFVVIIIAVLRILKPNRV